MNDSPAANHEDANGRAGRGEAREGPGNDAHPRGRRRVRAAFGPQWLLERLTQLLPGFPDVSVCVALSGGVDSTALLAALSDARAQGLRLRAVHVDHRLQPASRRWSGHCRRLARTLGVPLRVSTVTVQRKRGGSLEEAARIARYRCLAAQLRQGEALLTAHTQDDQLETVLLQLLRGCGLAGLAAMPATAPFGTGLHVRPLLERTREEIEAWVRGRGIAWIEDDSNADERFDRNYLRWRVLPAVRARWSGVAAAVARSARHAAEAQQLLESLARVDVERASDGSALSAKVLRTLPMPRRRNALRFWIAARGRVVPDTRRLEEIAGSLIDARADAHPYVEWGNTRLERYADRLSIGEAGGMSEARRAPQELAWDLGVSLRCELPQERGTLELAPDPHGPLDLDALPARLSVRWRRGGERLRVRRGGARRALKSLLQEERVPLAERARMPLIFAEGALLAAGDLWLDESVSVGPGTTRRGRLTWKRAPPASR